MDEEKKRELAWVGDAVLALFAREWILKQRGLNSEARTEAFISMTSNGFLAHFGEPTAVEARIGLVYHTDGLSHAFALIENEFLPLWHKQRANQRRGLAGKK
jgi:23S rRNA maturation mini-RNase III